MKIVTNATAAAVEKMFVFFEYANNAGFSSTCCCSDGYSPWAFLRDFWKRIKYSIPRMPHIAMVPAWKATPAIIRPFPMLSRLICLALAIPPPEAWSRMETMSHPTNNHVYIIGRSSECSAPKCRVRCLRLRYMPAARNEGESMRQQICIVNAERDHGLWCIMMRPI